MTEPATSRARWRDIAAAGHTGDASTALAAMADEDAVSRELALGALQRLGSLTDAQLSASLADVDPRVRRRAAMIAGTRPSISLLTAMRDPVSTVAEAAAWAAGEHEVVDDATLSTLIDLATSASDALVREASVASLGAIGDERGLPAILTACTDKPAVRRRAVLALAPFDGDAVDAALRVALEDRDWQVRQSAEDVLRAAGDLP